MYRGDVYCIGTYSTDLLKQDSHFNETGFFSFRCNVYNAVKFYFFS